MPTGNTSPENNRPTPDARPERHPPRLPGQRRPQDRLELARGLVGAALLAVALMVVTLGVDTLRGVRTHEDQAAALYRAIGLNELALTPSGRQARRPAQLPTAIDWRYDPALPKQAPEEILLLERNQLTAPEAIAP